ALLDPRRNHLGDIAPAERDPFPGEFDGASFRFDLGGQAFELLNAGDERREVESERELKLPSPALPREAFAVWTVAPEHEPGVDQACQMPAQRRGGHPMRPQRELLIRGEDDQVVSGESRLW